MQAQSRRAVYFFCQDLAKDPVAARVFDACKASTRCEQTGMEIDGHPVLVAHDIRGNQFLLVQTDEVVTDEYERYLPIVNTEFVGCEFAAVVNWHEGENAPDEIFTVHSNGDVVSGYFGIADPRSMRGLMRALDVHRLATGLETFKTITEGTHWSGTVIGRRPELVAQCKIPMLDVEIGSSPGSWTNTVAIQVLAGALFDVFIVDQGGELRSLLCVGGVHLDPAFPGAVLNSAHQYALAISHILPTRWLVDGSYDTDAGFAKLEACVNSIIGGIDAVAYHDSLKSAYKAQVRRLAEKLAVPMFKHQLLRQPDALHFGP